MKNSDVWSDFTGVSFSQYVGTWYAIAKKDPEGLFLIDNIVANFLIDEEGKMTATAEGRVIILKWVP